MMNGLQRGKWSFEEQSLCDIDGNHSLHAMRNLRDDERFAEREVVIYSKMSEEQSLCLISLALTGIRKLP